VATFSPDGRRFAIVLRKGNLLANSNDYSLVLFRTETAFQHPVPDILVSFSSSSNRAGIDEIRWLGNHTLTFLAEKSGESHQLYTFDCITRRLKKLTHHMTSVVDYMLSDTSGRFSFLAQKATNSLLDAEAAEHGIVVLGQPLADLVAVEDRQRSEAYLEIFSQEGNVERMLSITDQSLVYSPPLMWPSPNGRYLVVKSLPNNVPDHWRDYDDKFLRGELEVKHNSGTPRWIFQYQLFDTLSGATRPLIDAPLGKGHAQAYWCAASRSVIVINTFLPLNVANATERTRRLTQRYIAEVNLATGEVTPVTTREFKIRAWECERNRLVFEPTSWSSTADVDGPSVAYERESTGWTQVFADVSELNGNRPIEVTLEEDLNTPPKIFVTDLRGSQKALLLDLNPQFQLLKFGRVQDVTFRAKDGHDVRAGLYLPPDYIAERKYPAVIQTHGWNPNLFWIDGPHPSAFAAQSLSARGIVGLQLEEPPADSTPDETSGEEAAYEGAIDYLVSRELVNRDQVGIIGFSRTGLTVKFTLTHSIDRFAAATIADPSDGGYFDYLAQITSMPFYIYDSEGLNGGLPFGSGLASWLTRSPGFNLNRVSTPTRLEVYSPSSLFANWEWFAGLWRQEKPVEMIYMPDAAHALVKPWNRLTSQQGNVDWFDFWLNGHEDPDPAKAEQYTRWRKLREMQKANEAAKGTVH